MTTWVMYVQSLTLGVAGSSQEDDAVGGEKDVSLGWD